MLTHVLNSNKHSTLDTYWGREDRAACVSQRQDTSVCVCEREREREREREKELYKETMSKTGVSRARPGDLVCVYERDLNRYCQEARSMPGSPGRGPATLMVKWRLAALTALARGEE